MSFFTEQELANLRRETVVVLWDLVECPIPDGMDVVTATGNIRLALKNAGYHGGTDINVFGDAMRMPLEEFAKVMVGCNDLPEGDGVETRRQMILSEFLCRAVYYHIQVSLMLIMGDISGHVQFSNAFDLLKRKRYNIILAQPKEDMPMLKDIHVYTTWLWDTLSVGGQALKTLKFADDDVATSITFPQTMSPEFGNYYDAYSAETIIFWDISGCKPPREYDVLDVLANIAESLDDEGCGNLTSSSIRFYCDIFEMAEVLCHTNIGMLHGSTEEDRRKKIFVDFMCMAVGNLDSLNLLLIMEDISGRPEFLHAFEFFQYSRKNVKIFLSQPHRGDVSDELLRSVEAAWVWEMLYLIGDTIGDEDKKEKEKEKEKKEEKEKKKEDEEEKEKKKEEEEEEKEKKKEEKRKKKSEKKKKWKKNKKEKEKKKKEEEEIM